jgi:transposase
VHRRAWHGCRSSRSASPGVHRTRGQDLLDAFTAVYNHQRPHRSLPHRATPATAYAARPKAVAGDRVSDSHDRVRSDRISKTGNVTLRTGGRLHHKRNTPDQMKVRGVLDVLRHHRVPPARHPHHGNS